jgi:hypothetical protein
MPHQERSYPNAHPVARRLLELKAPTESLAAYAETLGLSPQKFSNWLNNGDAPSYEAILDLLTKNDLNPMWLLTGEGPARRVEPDEANLRLWLARMAVVGNLEDIEALVRSDAGALEERRKAAEGGLRYGAAEGSGGTNPDRDESPEEVG